MKIMLDNGAICPTRAHATDAGLDLYSREEKTIYPCRTMESGIEELQYTGAVSMLRWSIGETFDTGVHIAFDRGTYGKIESKSGLNVNHSVVSCGGVVDEGYTGSIAVKIYNLGIEPYTVHKGDKIAQLVIMPYLTPEIEIVSNLDDTDRGNNGFGSTGR